MNPVGNWGGNISSYCMKNQGENIAASQLSKQALAQAENSIPKAMRASFSNCDTVEISGQKSAVSKDIITIGNIPITIMEKPPIKTSTQFTNSHVSQAAQQLANLMDENSEDLHWKICSGMSEKQLADHFGNIGKEIDDAFAAGAITQQEYEDLNLGLEKYTEIISCKAEHEAASWEVAKQCVQATQAKIKDGASGKEMERYAEENKETFQNNVSKFIKDFCSIDRTFLFDLIQRVRAGEKLFSEGTEHTYTRENTIGYFKNGYVPFVPVEYL